MVALTLLGLSMIASCIKSADLPSFIMIMVDDMGWGDTEYNNGSAYTPYIQQWIHDPHVITFQRGYSGSPVCSPTRASVLTGRAGDRECIYSANQSKKPAWEESVTLPLPTSTFTIAEAVKKADDSYQTAFFGKWHLGDFWDKGEGNKVSNPGNNGFDYWFASEGSVATATPNCACQAFENDPDYKETCVLGHFDEFEFCKSYWYQNDSRSTDVANITYLVDRNYNNDTNNERNTYFLVTKFEEWLDTTADLDKPMLVVMWWHAPHTPIISNDEFRDGCQDGIYCKPKADGSNYTSNELDYWGLIADIDTQIGRVRSLLREYGIWNNTWIWFNSDNGPQSGQPGLTNGLRGKKDDVWEGGIRVPTIMEWPGVIPNDSFATDYPVVTYDLLPTILDVLDVTSNTPDWKLDGQSIMKVLESGGLLNESRDPIGFTYGGSGLSLAWMDMEWKLVDNSNSCDGDECEPALYNLHDDPFEVNDLSSEYQDRFDSMYDDMYDWYKGVLKSQLKDSKCIVDRIVTYWEYVAIGVGVGLVVLCCCCCACCAAVKLGYLTCCAGLYCCKWVANETKEGIEMAQNTTDHEKTTSEDKLAENGLQSETSI